MTNDKKTYIIACAILCVLVGWLLCRNNDTGVGFIGNQFEPIRNQQQEITSEIKDTRDKLGDAQRATDNLQSEIKESGAIIAECQRIIREVRARNERGK